MRPARRRPAGRGRGVARVTARTTTSSERPPQHDAGLRPHSPGAPSRFLIGASEARDARYPEPSATHSCALSRPERRAPQQDTRRRVTAVPRKQCPCVYVSASEQLLFSIEKGGEKRKRGKKHCCFFLAATTGTASRDNTSAAKQGESRSGRGWTGWELGVHRGWSRVDAVRAKLSLSNNSSCAVLVDLQFARRRDCRVDRVPIHSRIIAGALAERDARSRCTATLIVVAPCYPRRPNPPLIAASQEKRPLPPCRAPLMLPRCCPYANARLPCFYLRSLFKTFALCNQSVCILHFARI